MNYVKDTYVIDNLSKVNRSFSDWTEILEGVPQDSIFGSLLFNIFINDIFLFINNSTLCNCADDKTLYAINKNLHMVKSNFEANFHK